MNKHLSRCGDCCLLESSVEIYKSPYGETEVLGKGKVKARIVKICRAGFLSKKCHK